MKGTGHGVRHYSYREQHAADWIHLFRRDPHLAKLDEAVLSYELFHR